jgi:hypothetical protein
MVAWAMVIRFMVKILNIALSLEDFTRTAILSAALNLSAIVGHTMVVNMHARRFYGADE